MSKRLEQRYPTDYARSLRGWMLQMGLLQGTRCPGGMQTGSPVLLLQCVYDTGGIFSVPLNAKIIAAQLQQNL
ncbi:MAG TPA: hypothetical protein VGX50_17825, partial [Longimicrobium sp.]|nr:hypothetical protein [Longimicrobium sp.]